MPVGSRRLGLTSASLLLMIAVLAWAGSGHAAAVPVTLVGGAAIAAALADVRTGRIPNAIIVCTLAVEAAAWPLIAYVDDRAVMPLLADLGAGLALSGAPALFVVWLVAPRVLGGGDWKLLSVLGIAVGFLAPLGATVIVMGAFVGGTAIAAVSRRRNIILGPPLALGYITAIAAVIAWPDVFANWYQ